MNVQKTLPTRSGSSISNAKYSAFRLQRGQETAVVSVRCYDRHCRVNAAPAVFWQAAAWCSIDNRCRMFDQCVLL